MKHISLLAACTLLPTTTTAQVTVTNQTAPIPIAEDFNTYTMSEVSGILVIPGARIAEDCFGQTTVKNGAVEVTTGNPTNPPTLRVPPAHDGVYTSVINSLGSLAGMAEGNTIDEIGEGAITIVYDTAQAQIGLRISGSNPGSGIARFQFFASNGGLIAAVNLPSSPDRDITVTTNSGAIRAVTFTNSGDLQGLALDDLRHWVLNTGPATFCFGDGGGTACPCANTGQQDHGCANGSFASGARLTHTASGGLQVRWAASNQPILFFRGTQPIAFGAGAPFGDGLRCVGSNIVRLGVMQGTFGGWATLTSLPPQGPGTHYYQAWYRDPQGSLCGTNFNTTNGVSIP